MATTFTAPATMYDTPAAANAGYQALIAKQQADQAAKHRSAVTKTLLGGAALFGGALAAPALAGSFGAMSGGSAAVAAPTWGTVAGTTSGGLAGGGMGVPWWKLGELAVGTFGNIYGANKSQSANRESLRAQMAGQTQAEILAREQMAEEKRQFELTRQEQAAQWAVDMQLKVRHIDCPNHPAGEYIRCAVLYQTAWMGLDEQKILQIECAKQGSELPAGCRLFASPP